MTIVLKNGIVRFFVVLPLFLLTENLGPIHALKGVVPTMLVTLFAGDSTTALPMAVRATRSELKISGRISHFMLPVYAAVGVGNYTTFVLMASLFLVRGKKVPLP